MKARIKLNIYIFIINTLNGIIIPMFTYYTFYNILWFYYVFFFFLNVNQLFKKKTNRIAITFVLSNRIMNKIKCRKAFYVISSLKKFITLIYLNILIYSVDKT